MAYSLQILVTMSTSSHITSDKNIKRGFMMT